MAISSTIPNANKVPGTYLRVSLGVGARSSGDSTRYEVLLGNKTTAGTMPLETEVDCYGEDEARTLCGEGSELFHMARAAFQANPSVALKLVAVTASAGAAATGTLVFTGPATTSGTVGVSVLGEAIEVPFSAGDTATAIGAAVAAAINAQADWPLTAANATGTVTVTARHAGPRGNHLALRARIIAGTGVGVTPPATGYLTGGTTSDDPQAALDMLSAVQRTYVIAPYVDATQLQKFKSHVDAEEEPLIGHRKWVLFGSTDTLGATTTLTTGLNFPRLQCAWQEKSDVTPAMLAAALGARRALQESLDAAYNFDGEVIPGLPPHANKADVPTATELAAALNQGITPLTSTNAGDVIIVRSITTKSQDAAGRPDYRVLDTHKVTVSDEIAERFELRFADRFTGFKASDNPPDDAAPPPRVCTPAMCTDLAYEILSEAEESDGLLDLGSVERRKNEIVFELSKIAHGRFNGIVPIDIIEHAHQFAADIRQIG